MDRKGMVYFNLYVTKQCNLYTLQMLRVAYCIDRKFYSPDEDKEEWDIRIYVADRAANELSTLPDNVNFWAC